MSIAIADFLSPEDVLYDFAAPDKSRLLQQLAERAATKLGLDGAAVLEAILGRETLGSTGVGGGVAIPHARIAGLHRPFGEMARLRRGMDFDAIDAKAVDIVFFLLLPADQQNAQINTLAAVARALREPAMLAGIRGATSAGQIWAVLKA